MALAFFVMFLGAVNCYFAVWHILAARKAVRLHEALLLLCTDAWKLRPWPRQHIVFDDWPAPFRDHQRHDNGR